MPPNFKSNLNQQQPVLGQQGNLQSPPAAKKPTLNQTPLNQKLPFKKAYYKTLAKGSLVTCKYLYWKHDPNPLILVTDVTPEYIRGVNLHYLTFKYVRSLLQYYCGKAHFSYKFIKHDRYIVNSFRTYKRAGISQINVLDCDVINQQLTLRRSFNPQEIKEIKRKIRESFRNETNINAKEMSQNYINMMKPNQGLQNQTNQMRQDGRFTFKPAANYNDLINATIAGGRIEPQTPPDNLQ